MTSAVDLIRAGDADALRGALAADPSLARAGNGAESPLLLALYQGRPDLALIIQEATSSDLTLFEAAAVGDVRRVAALCAADPTASVALAPDGFSALHLAAYFGREAVVQRLLRAGAYSNRAAANASRVRPLHSATSAEHAEIVRALLDAGADPSAPQEGGWTPLHQAAHSANRPIMQLLLQHGADRTARSADGRTPAEMLPEGNADLAALLSGKVVREERRRPG